MDSQEFDKAVENLVAFNKYAKIWELMGFLPCVYPEYKAEKLRLEAALEKARKDRK